MNTKYLTLEERIDKVMRLRGEGYNCSQCVLMAFADVTGLPDATAARIAAESGGGFGLQNGICGALTAAAMVDGFTSWKTPADKAASYRSVREITEEFRSGHGAIHCDDLKKELHRPCNDLILQAVTMMHNRLNTCTGCQAD